MYQSEEEFINLTEENIESEHLCCIIRQKPHPGVEAKRAWLRERLKEDHVFRKLNAKETCFIEYAPVETAWVPVEGDHFLYIYCLWVTGNCKGKGYAKKLMEYCLEDAKSKGKSGICMLGAKRQKHWLANQDFACKFGFEVVDSTDNDYELFALSFDGTKPHFTETAKKLTIDCKEPTIYYDYQCPFMVQYQSGLEQYCKEKSIPAHFIQVDSLEKAKNLPGVFNNWAVFCNGKFETVNLIGGAELEKMMIKGKE